MEARDIHADVSRTLARLLVTRTAEADLEEPGSDQEFVRDWYLLVAAHLHRTLRVEQSRAHLAEARRQFPDDGRVLLASGADHEVLSAVTMGWVQFRNVAGERTSQERVNQARELQRAAEFYRTAIQASPDLAEARLRLGRVLHRLGEAEAARRELELVQSRIRDPALEYLAAVFLALIEVDRQQHARARDLYAQAARIHPGGYAVLVGVSELAYRTGRPAEAADLMRRLLLRGNDRDPWWGYLLGTSWHVDALRASLSRRMRE